MSRSTCGQTVIDGLTGLLIGMLLGPLAGLAVGLACGLLLAVIPFLAVVGIMVVIYGVSIGLVSGTVTGLFCGLISGDRVKGVTRLTLPLCGAMIGGLPAIPLMLALKSYGWENARPELFLAFGATAGALCGMVVALAVGVMNHRPRRAAVAQVPCRPCGGGKRTIPSPA